MVEFDFEVLSPMGLHLAHHAASLNVPEGVQVKLSRRSRKSIANPFACTTGRESEAARPLPRLVRSLLERHLRSAIGYWPARHASPGVGSRTGSAASHVARRDGDGAPPPVVAMSIPRCWSWAWMMIQSAPAGTLPGAGPGDAFVPVVVLTKGTSRHPRPRCWTCASMRCGDAFPHVDIVAVNATRGAARALQVLPGTRTDWCCSDHRAPENPR
jgi:hypothetical protein